MGDVIFSLSRSLTFECEALKIAVRDYADLRKVYKQEITIHGWHVIEHNACLVIHYNFLAF